MGLFMFHSFNMLDNDTVCERSGYYRVRSVQYSICGKLQVSLSLHPLEEKPRARICAGSFPPS